MKKIKNLVIGGIQNKVFNLALITIILMIGVFAAVAVYEFRMLSRIFEETHDRQKDSILMLSSQTMDGVVDSSLSTTTDLEAYMADDMFGELKNEVGLLAEYAEDIAQNPENYEAARVGRPQKGLNGTVAVQLATASGVDVNSPEVDRAVKLFGNMSEVLKATYNNMNINSCYISTPEGIMIVADPYSGDRVDDDGNYVTIESTERSWYKGAVEAGDTYFSDIMTDTFNGRKTIVCSKPVYYKNGDLAGVVGIDLYLDSMADAVAQSVKDGTFVYIVNNRGHIVFSPMTSGTFKAEIETEATDLRKSENADLAAFISDALEGKTDIRQIDADGNTWYMSGAPLPTIGWALINAVDKSVTDQPTVLIEEQYEKYLEEAAVGFRDSQESSKTTVLLLLGLVFVIALAMAASLGTRMVKPLNTLSKRIGELGEDNLQFKMEDRFRTGDEIEVLAESFADLSRKTVQYINEVTRVTAEKEHIEAELDMAKAIQDSQLPNTFPAYPDRGDFDIFASMTPAKQVGGDFYDFFMTDDDHIVLVMADVAGKGVPAALFMMVSRILIKNRICTGESPGEALYNVNNQLLEGNETELFVTVWLAVIEISTGKGVSVNAGHEHPALRHAGGRYELVEYKHSPAVSVMEGLKYKEREFMLEPGDSIFVYTDGVAEATDIEDQLFGSERLLEALNEDPDADPTKILENVKRHIDDFVAGEEQFDDITMLAFKYIGSKG
ncbi:MAG: SpoIIE family protein phosphatase [Lachnospiraceae bacterium]|nr:SpoIIE family protein phosphatase [Lachnospiraceae bacterium]